MVTAAINGFGRIGRIAFRVALEKYSSEIEIVAINTSGSMDAEGWAHLLQYDSVYGRFQKQIEGETGGEDPATGVFASEEGARQHLTGGAKRVVISAPDRGGNVGTFLIGVNEYDGKFEIVSNGSCTTNCVAPVASIMESAIGIKKAMLSTIHALTAEQNIVDGSPPGGHSTDLRRARAALGNIIPTSTGAAETVAKTIPELKGLFDGMAIRVPVVCGSITDFTFVTSRPTTVEEVNGVFKKAANEERWKGILAVTDEPLVSSDIVGRSESAIVDLSLTKVEDHDLVKVLAWYDNEWAFSCRLIEQVVAVGKSLTNNA